MTVEAARRTIGHQKLKTVPTDVANPSKDGGAKLKGLPLTFSQDSQLPVLARDQYRRADETEGAMFYL